jgi:hypothetical protein
MKAFKNWLPGKSVHVKPVGGKRLLRGMARNVVERDLKKTIVAMDRDYDGESGQIIDDHRVVYTLGYSVENDLCNAHSLKHVAEVITRNEPLDQAISTEVDQIGSSLSASFTRVVALDYVYYRSGHALIDRDVPGKTVKSSSRGTFPPELNRPGILTQLRKAKGEISGRWHGDLPDFSNVSESLVGKTLISAIYHYMIYILKKNAVICKITKDHFIDLLLDSWRGVNNRIGNCRLNEYYTTMFARI